MPHCCSRGICGAAVPFVQPSPDSTFRFFGGKLGVVRHSSWSYHALVTFVRHSYGIRLLAVHFASAYFWANMAAPTRNSTNATRMPYECHTNATRMPHDNFVTFFFGEPHEKIKPISHTARSLSRLRRPGQKFEFHAIRRDSAQKLWHFSPHSVRSAGGLRSAGVFVEK